MGTDLHGISRDKSNLQLTIHIVVGIVGTDSIGHDAVIAMDIRNRESPTTTWQDTQ